MQEKTIKGDMFGGIAAGIVALPLALAFGVQSGLGAQAGLYGAIAVGFFASLFGGTPSQVSGPTGPMTVISAIVIAHAIELNGSIEAAMPTIIMTFFTAGIILLLFGFSKIGQSVRYIPYPVVSGFMSGIGVIIICLQIFPMMGQSSPNTIINIFLGFDDLAKNINYYALMLSIATILITYLFPYITRTIPSLLVALIVLTMVTDYFQWSVPTIGTFSAALPEIKLSAFEQFNFYQIATIIIPAATLAALSAIDSLLTSVVADNLTKTKHNSDKELIGQGIGNMASALIGGIPGAGATLRTVVNIKSGGHTRLSGMFHAILLFIVLVGAGKYAAKIPLAVLAGILITVGIGIIDYKGWKHLLHVPKSDALVMLSVFLLTVFVDLLQAVAIGMVLASVLFMKKMGDINKERTKISTLEDLQREKPWSDDNLIPQEFSQEVCIKHLEGPLFFGFTSQFQELVATVPSVKYIIIRMKRVPYIDQSGIYAIEEAVLYLRNKNIHVLLSGVQPQPKDMLKRIQLIPNLISDEHVFEDFRDCVAWVKQQKNITITD